MKRFVIYLMALLLPVWVLSSCKNYKPSADASQAAVAKDTTAAQNTQQDESEGQEVSDEEMEGQSGMHDPGDIERFWKKHVISVPGQKSDIVALFEAFYTQWPTVEGSRIVHVTNPTLAPDEDNFEEGSIIDRKNGYVESAWYEGEPLGTVSSCVWNRKNGHKLFAVSFQGDKDFVCFYDFDPAKRTLTPEESPIKKEHLNFPDKTPAWYTLPHEGKTLEVVEETPGDEVAFTYYTFDGQNLKYAGHER